MSKTAKKTKKDSGLALNFETFVRAALQTGKAPPVRKKAKKRKAKK